MKKIINTSEAPAPIGPYSQAVRTGDLLFVSGQIAIEPSSGNIVVKNIKAETVQVMENLHAILSAAGMDFNNVIKTSIFLKDLNNFVHVNEIYGKYFPADPPARETVEVSRLPKDVNVEISIVASL